MSNTDWLANIKVGDEVIIDSSNGKSVVPVVRLTPSMVCVKHPTSFKDVELQFNRRTGRQRGEYASSGRFGWRPRLQYGDAAAIQACKDLQERTKIADKLTHRINWRALTLAQLRAVDAILTPKPEST